MDPIVRILAENPLLLLFLVCAIGYPLGQIRVGGASLGTASILFVGIAVGALDPRLRIPDVVTFAGLALFVYIIGLNSSAGFFAAFSRRGLRETSLALGALALAGVLDFLLARHFGIGGAMASALYSGAFTNASGLAGIVDAVKAAGGDATALSVPVVGYSLAYPIGILGPMIVIVVAQRIARVDLRAEALTIPSFRKRQEQLEIRTIEVTNPDVEGVTIGELMAKHGSGAILGRILRDSTTILATGSVEICPGDRIVVTGSSGDLDRLTELLGQASDVDHAHDRGDYEVRRMFVSNAGIVGRALRELDLPRRIDAVITRVRRGDLDFIPTGDTQLELGDRVRVLTLREKMANAASYFGDSYRAVSEIDFFAISIGLAAGLALGLVPIPLPGGITFRLGLAGGPLLVALLVGRVRRTGRIVWSLPYSASVTLRQFGLVLFAAGIGTRAGYDFAHTLSQGKGFDVFLVGAALTFTTGAVFFFVGYRLLRIPMNHLVGLYAGAQTQPVVLSFASDQTKNDLPNAGYASIFPLATIGKILVSQLLYVALTR